jgi:hypothetical protein
MNRDQKNGPATMPGRSVSGGIQILFPAAQHCGNYARIPTPVEDRNDPQRFPFGSICDQVFPNQLESEWASGEFGSKKSVVRELGEQIERVEEFADEA